MQDPLPIKPLTGPFDAVMRPPGSKSLTNRAMLLAALGAGESTLSNVLFADDTRVMINALKAMGFKLKIDESKKQVIVNGLGGQISANKADLFLGNSGTATRFLSAACCLGDPGSEYILDGVPRMRERPIAELVDALRTLGAKIEYLEKDGFPPLQVSGGGLKGKTLTLKPTVSSQFITALMQIGPYLPGGLTLEFDGPVTSLSYVRMTQQLMALFGIQSEVEGDFNRVSIPHSAYQAQEYLVEADASNASYFLCAAAAWPDASCRIAGLGDNSLQGDARFVEVLQKMGATVDVRADTLVVTGPARLRGVDVPLNDMPDMAQTLAVLALFAEGSTIIRDVGNLRVKETDRLAALRNELTKLGANVTIKGDDIQIVPPPENKLKSADVDTYDDHRMAMSFAVAGLRQSGIRIKAPACVNKTYPDFFKDLATLEHGGNAR